jgi:osmotically-inducible protein OsmY
MKSDERLQREVVEALTREPLLDGASPPINAELGVTASDGVVTLTGRVDTFLKKIAAERAAKSVPGVLAIAEEVQVQAGRPNRRSDAEIAKDALSRLRQSDDVPHERVTIIVEDGCVKLEGDVEWQFEKDEALREIEGLDGVVKIINLISIRPELRLEGIKGNFLRSLQRAFL